MLLALACRGHEPLIFEPGWCHRCGRMLEPELGEGVFTDGAQLLLARIFQVRDELEAEAAALGLTFEEFQQGPLRRRLGDGRAPSAPSGETTVLPAPA